MITDALVSFGTVTPTTAADYPSAVIDLLGSGVGTAPPSIIGNATLFGEDVGIGSWRAQTEVLVTAAFVGGTSVQVKFQAAPDVAVTHVPTTWTTLVETPAILTASLTLGQVLARFDYPPAFPANLNPRYLRLLFTTLGTFSAGTVLAPTTMFRDDQANKQAAANFVVA